jgi:ABC-type uncharacterized transport system permease subunit
MNEQQFTLPLLHSTLGIMTPLLLAATGGLFTELAGMLNIALEGLMLCGAFFSVAFTVLTGSLFWGIAGGIAASLLLALLFGLVSLYLRANIFITGLATNLLAPGLTAVIAFELFANKGVIRVPGRLPLLVLPRLHSLPLLGDILSGHTFVVYAGWLLLALAWLVIYKTPFGLRLRGSGLNGETVRSLGVRPRRYRLAGVLISGFTCGLAGAGLSLSLGAYVPNLTAGRGWIALVAIYLGGRKPWGILAACLLFGFAESLSNYAQGAINIPADFILALPYLITVAAMIAYSMWRYYKRG